MVKVVVEDRHLAVYVDPRNRGEWEECVVIEDIPLPEGWAREAHVGLTASTGQLVDNHDIISLVTYAGMTSVLYIYCWHSGHLHYLSLLLTLQPLNHLYLTCLYCLLLSILPTTPQLTYTTFRQLTLSLPACCCLSFQPILHLHILLSFFPIPSNQTTPDLHYIHYIPTTYITSPCLYCCCCLSF